jgi:hypothetical protein
MTISELQKRILVMSLCARFDADLHEQPEGLRAVDRQPLSDVDGLQPRRAQEPSGALSAADADAPFAISQNYFDVTGGRITSVPKEAEKLFGGSIRTAVNADIDTWADLTTKDDKGKTRRLGLSTAIKIAEAIE